MMLAVSTPQKLGMAFAIILVIGWAIFIVAHIKRGGVAAGAEMEVAPNRKPYYDDDKLEGIKLERALVAALILLVIIAIGLPLYWLGEPTRQANAAKGFDNRAAASRVPPLSADRHSSDAASPGQRPAVRLRHLPRQQGPGRVHQLLDHRCRRAHPTGAVDGAAPQHRAGPLHP